MHAHATRVPLLVAALLAIAASASAQAITLVASGDTLRAAAPSFHFIEGPVVERLRDGRSIRVDIDVTVRDQAIGPDLARVSRTFTVSFDLWEERFAVVRTGTPPRGISHLGARDAEAWCLDQIEVPRAALAGRGRGATVWVRIEARADVPESRSPEAGVASALERLIETLGRRRADGRLRWAIEAGSLRLPE